MKKSKRNKALYDFLDKCGALERGGDAIVLAKREYELKSKREYMRSQRQKRKEYRFICDKEEEKILKEQTQKHHMAESVLVKRMVFAYIKQEYLVPDAEILNAISQSMLKTHSIIQRIEQKDSSWLGLGKYGNLKDAIRDLQESIYSSFAKPKRIEDEIRERLKINPAFKQALLNLIEEYDSKIDWPEH